MSQSMLLSFEMSVPGRGSNVIPAPEAPACTLPETLRRKAPPRLPELAETDVDRHYTTLAQHAYGVNCGFYPLGSCTMKYNPAVNEAAARPHPACRNWPKRMWIVTIPRLRSMPTGSTAAFTRWAAAP